MGLTEGTAREIASQIRREIEEQAGPEFYGQGEPLMEAAFASFLEWAWSDPETRAAFGAETGRTIAVRAIDIMIDQATGYDKEVAEAFVRWAIENLWGLGCDGR